MEQMVDTETQAPVFNGLRAEPSTTGFGLCTLKLSLWQMLLTRDY